MTSMFYRILTYLTGSPQGKYISSFHRIEIHSWMSTWIIPFIAFVIAALSIYHYSKEKTLNKKQKIVLTALRFLAYLSILFILALPTLEIEGEGSFPGPVPVVIDGTESMLIKDVNNEKARFEKALEIYNEIKKNNPYKNELNLTGYWAGREFYSLESQKTPAPDADYTSISQMLEKGIQRHLGEYCPGFILISDGAHNSSEIPDNSLKFFQKRSIPVYTCGVGKEKSKDISVTYILGEDVVFIDEKAKIYINLVQNGYSSQDIDLKLYLGDKMVYAGQQRLEKDGEISVPVEYIPKEKGNFQLKAEVKPLLEEITTENNSYSKNIRIIDEKIKILMLLGTPSWEYRYLMGAFERDKRVEVKAYLSGVDKRLFGKKGENSHFISNLPGDKTELNRSFDIVFISRIDLSELPADFVKSLRLFIEEEAGALAVLSDPFFIPYSLKDSPLEPLLPITVVEKTGRSYRDELFNPLTNEMKFEITDDGNAHQLLSFSGSREENKKIWAELPPVYSYYHSGRLKPSSINLLVMSEEHGRKKFPAIVYHSYGKGTVFFMAFDSTWRWRKEYGDRYFRDFWGKVVQFLGLPHLLNEVAQSSILTGKENYCAGEKISIRAKANNPDFSPYISDELEMTIHEAELEKTIRLLPILNRAGMYGTDYMPEIPGKLKLELPLQFSAKPVELQITKRQMEFQESGMNKNLLENISSATGGKFYYQDQSGILLKNIWEKNPKRPININVSLWDSLALVIAALMFFSLEWYFRKIYYLD